MIDFEVKGKKMYELASELFPICRSITGEGIRESIKIISDYISEDDGIGFNMINVPSGTKVFDWEVPEEWVIREAFVEDEKYNRIIDFKDNNLHVVGYSTPIDKWVGLTELKEHIYTSEILEEAIPYVTSYYKRQYGFCMSKKAMDALPEGKYHMVIDSEHIDGTLTYGELILPGKTTEEIFFSTYLCHPAMANNECSGPVLMAELVKYLKKKTERRYTYRFIIIPETIGSITYLATENHLHDMKKNMVAGFNLSCVGDDGDYSVVSSRYGNTLADKSLKNILKFKTNNTYKDYSFLKRGSDERQYNAPGIDLPVVCFCRTKFHEYKEYHTSFDDLSFISPSGFSGGLEVMVNLIDTLEHNRKYKVLVKCEPQLGKRGLYPETGQVGTQNLADIAVNLLAYMDGTNDFFDLSEIIGVPPYDFIDLIKRFNEEALIEETDCEG